jgi:uncharacterized protein with FMN-binding domain
MTGGVLILLGGAIAAGAAQVADRHGEPRGQRIPNDLVTLSAAAIIAVYATGFQRTKGAADEFQAQAARRRVHPTIASATEPTKAGNLSTRPATQAASEVAIVAPTLSRSPVPTPGKDRVQRSPIDVQNMAPAAAPAEAQLPMPVPVVTGSDSAPRATIATDGFIATGTATSADIAAPTDVVMPKLHYKDGTYLAWGRCAHGRIQASVVIKNGRIDSATIAQCETAYPCERIDALPGQVMLKQDPNVDVVTGASDSSYAFLDAVAAAMFRGQRGE